MNKIEQFGDAAAVLAAKIVPPVALASAVALTGFTAHEIVNHHKRLTTTETELRQLLSNKESILSDSSAVKLPSGTVIIEKVYEGTSEGVADPSRWVTFRMMHHNRSRDLCV